MQLRPEASSAGPPANTEPGYTITKAGLPVVNSSNTLGVSSFKASSVFVEFVHSNNGPDGPEARSPGWKYSSWRAEFFE